jgi:hypothetical protein
MVVMPPCQVRNLLMTHGAETVLRLPKIQQSPPPLQVSFHLHAEAFFEVHLPLGVIPIGSHFDFGMPPNRHAGRFQEILLFYCALCTDRLAVKNPVTVA